MSPSCVRRSGSGMAPVEEPVDPLQWPEERRQDPVQKDGGEQEEPLGQERLDEQETSDGEREKRLEDERRRNDQQLKGRFEHIFEKYERDFTGVGDEIDLKTGEIVVDNGHLEGMEHEADPGEGASSQFVRAFQENLEHESEDGGSSGSESEGEDGDSEESGEQEEDEDRSGGLRDWIFGGREQSTESSMQPTSADEMALDPLLRDLTDAAAVPAPFPINNLDCTDEGQASTAHGTRASSTSPSEQSDTSSGASFNVMDLPAVKEQMEDFRSLSKRRRDVDPEAIQALGLSIANQIAQYIGANGKSKKRKRDKKKQSSAWDFPQLPSDKRRKTAAVAPPPPRPCLPQLSTAISPQAKLKKTRREPLTSLWTPITHPKPRRSGRKQAAEAAAGEASVHVTHAGAGADTQAESEQQAGTDGAPRLKQCYNCNICATTAWRLGPGGDLCNACWMYLYRYGLMRPPRLSTPQQESDEEAPDPAQYSANTSRPISSKGTGVFSCEEDALIVKLKEIDLMSWEKIGRHFEGRSAFAVQCRYSKRLVGQPSPGRDALIEQGFSFDKSRGETREGDFTEQDDILLVQLREEHQLDWVKIAERLPHRTAENIETRYNLLLGNGDPHGLSAKVAKRPKSKRDRGGFEQYQRVYAEKEDELLVKLREVDKLPWQAVAEQMPGRSALAIQKRYVRVLERRKTVVAKGDADPFAHLFAAEQPANNVTNNVDKKKRKVQEKFTAHSSLTLAEEALLMRLVDDEGLGWEKVAEQIRGRSTHVLKSRYEIVKEKSARAKEAADLLQRQDVYDIPVSEGYRLPDPAEALSAENDPKYTKAEDNLILRLKDEQGLDWHQIAQRLPWRTGKSLESRWRHHLRCDANEENPEPDESGYEAAVDNDEGSIDAVDPVLEQVPSVPAECTVDMTRNPDQRNHVEGSAALPVLAPITTPAHPGSSYSEHEHDIVVKLSGQLLDWTDIATQLPGRTASSVYKYYTLYIDPTREGRPRPPRNRPAPKKDKGPPLPKPTYGRRGKPKNGGLHLIDQDTPIKSPEAFLSPLSMVSPGVPLDDSCHPVNLFHSMLNVSSEHAKKVLPRLEDGRYQLAYRSSGEPNEKRASSSPLLPSVAPVEEDHEEFDLLSLGPSPILFGAYDCRSSTPESLGGASRIEEYRDGGNDEDGQEDLDMMEIDHGSLNDEQLNVEDDQAMPDDTEDTSEGERDALECSESTDDEEYDWGDEDEVEAVPEDADALETHAMEILAGHVASCAESGSDSLQLGDDAATRSREAEDEVDELQEPVCPLIRTQHSDHASTRSREAEADADELQEPVCPFTPVQPSLEHTHNPASAVTQIATPTDRVASPVLTYCTPARWNQQQDAKPYFAEPMAKLYSPILEAEEAPPASDASADDDIVSPQQRAADARASRSATPTDQQEATIPSPVNHSNPMPDTDDDTVREHLRTSPGVSLGNDQPPPFSWAELVTMALKATPDQRLPTRGIQRYLEGKFPYFRTCGDRGKDALRRFLDATSEFDRLGDSITAPWTFARRVREVPLPKRRPPNIGRGSKTKSRELGGRNPQSAASEIAASEDFTAETDQQQDTQPVARQEARVVSEAAPEAQCELDLEPPKEPAAAVPDEDQEETSVHPEPATEVVEPAEESTFQHDINLPPASELHVASRPEPTAPKRKAARPRKHPLPRSNTTKPPRAADAAVSQDDAPLSLSELLMQENIASSPKPAMPKRKVGRPRRHPLPDRDQSKLLREGPAAPEPTDKMMSQDRDTTQQLASEEANAAASPKPAASKRKAGRPRKNPLKQQDQSKLPREEAKVLESADTLVQDHDTIRPLASKETIALSPKPAAPKRKAGRPRKHPLPDPDKPKVRPERPKTVRLSEPGPQPPRKRPKKVSLSEPLVTLSDDESTSSETEGDQFEPLRNRRGLTSDRAGTDSSAARGAGRKTMEDLLKNLAERGEVSDSTANNSPKKPKHLPSTELQSKSPLHPQPATHSSSPSSLFPRFEQPAKRSSPIVYSNIATPKAGGSLLNTHLRKRGLSAEAELHSRSTSRSGSAKRVLHTPMREVGDSEDELAL
ncbi:hypothetical protein B0A50_07364 [Salinomyces thailandicus]|uniref:Myb-like DNA-binding domain-containing protein n=1 Tax=Salinomyces thailandicus TaxID=706561 RepID=A0A4U0TM28_9PEZI|nr:hypothetical protein B0A50_07364 [Salinomyces thailandica]